MTMPTTIRPAVAIIGGGPSGLRAAQDLAKRVSGDVVVIERETEAGGIPRHSDHPGYGIRDLGRFMSGPSYARRLVDRARDAGASIRTGAMITGWADELALNATTPDGLLRIEPRAIVLATGARERARAARRIPGDRPAGVYTTGQLQNAVHLHHQAVGSRAVIVGAELVSWSAGMTLKEAGCRTVAMVTSHPRPDAYRVFSGPGSVLLHTRVRTSTRVTQIIGKTRVEAVEVEDLNTGVRSRIDCDTVVFTGDWIPDNELARTAGLRLDPGTLGPQVDSLLRTSRPGVFAIGNLVHPVDTADVAALDGAHVATSVVEHLEGRTRPAVGLRLLAESPFRWVAPNVLTPEAPAPARNRLLLWTEEYVRAPKVQVSQDGRVVSRRRVPWPAAPGRVFRIPSSVLDTVDPRGGDVRISLA
jgi:thioredoxin reductase